jgi:hypothetical protein
MLEKLGWAERSFERMKAAGPNHVIVQDHFWSFLHAIHLFWFYFKKWSKENAGIESPERRIERLKTRSLNAKEIEAWSALSELRNEDVHVQPVLTKEPGAALCVAGGALMVRHGALVVKKTPFRVGHRGHEKDLFPLCENGITAFRKLVERFDESSGK